MYYSYVEIDSAATSFSPARTDLALKLLSIGDASSYTGEASPGLNRGWKVVEGHHFQGKNKQFSHTSVSRNKFFLLELRTNCIVLYGTSLKTFFWGHSGTELYHTG